MKTQENQMTYEQLFDLQEALAGMMFIKNPDDFIRRVIVAFRVNAAAQDHVDVNRDAGAIVEDSEEEMHLLNLLTTLRDIRMANNDDLVLPDYPKDETQES